MSPGLDRPVARQPDGVVANGRSGATAGDERLPVSVEAIEGAIDGIESRLSDLRAALTRLRSTEGTEAAPRQERCLLTVQEAAERLASGRRPCGR